MAGGDQRGDGSEQEGPRTDCTNLEGAIRANSASITRSGAIQGRRNNFTPRAGLPIFELSKILGHSSPTLTMRYAHFSPNNGVARSTMDEVQKQLSKGPKKESST